MDSRPPFGRARLFWSNSRLRQLSSFYHQTPQSHIKWMVRIGAIEAMITVGPAPEDSRGPQLGEFLLDGVLVQLAEPRQLAHVEFLARVGEQQPQDLGSNRREQTMNQALIHITS